MDNDWDASNSQLDTGGVAAAVLAGGVGRRLGGDKASTLLAGRRLIEFPVMALRKAGFHPFIVTKRDRPVHVDGVPTITEPDQPRHPLQGVATAIRAASGRPVLLLACDMPMLDPGLLAWLAGQSGMAVVPSPGGRLQPLVARYAPESLARIEAGLVAGRSVTSTVEGLDPVILEDADLQPWGDPGVSFMNVNSPEDLARAESLLAQA